MAKGKEKTKGQTMIYKTLHGKLRIKQQKSTKKLVELSCSWKVSSSCSTSGNDHVTVRRYQHRRFQTEFLCCRVGSLQRDVTDSMWMCGMPHVCRRPLYFHIKDNWGYLSYKATFSLSQRWLLNTCLTTCFVVKKYTVLKSLVIECILIGSNVKPE